MVLSFSLPGCLSFLHPGSVDRPIEGTYDQVFQATLEVLEARGFRLERVDREVGRIVTGRRPVQIRGVGRQVEKVDARLEEDGGVVEVRLLMAFTDQLSNPPPPIKDRNENGRADEVAAVAFSRSVGAGAAYDDVLDAIEDRVRELRGNGGP